MGDIGILLMVIKITDILELLEKQLVKLVELAIPNDFNKLAMGGIATSR
jgi:hypothetical protein